ncbi:hypothetical protein [Streptomyces sp. NPDC052114]|uniref:hypothetical protein n=1 Tax=unclassified Streptomyces TaxID=2593676 RepID=UPI003435A55C
MHDPGSSSSSPIPQPDGQASAEDVAAAAEAVDQVLAWYSRQILIERRSSAPDPRRLEQLMAQRQVCGEDRDRLDEAGPQEVARLAAHYTARLQELQSTEP